MERKTSTHLRTLSRLGVDLQLSEQDVSSLAISKVATSDVQDVTGLAGRLRLQKQASSNAHGSPRNWMDNQRKHIQAYEYLCHIAEAKEWLEGCIGHSLAAVVDLEERLRDGVALAQLAANFKPELVPRIFEAHKLQFRHSDNINRFFKFLEAVKLPKTFQFELTDLYEKKNIPKVIYCIHALSFVLAGSGHAAQIGDLVGKIVFSDAEIRQTQQSLAATGTALPNFKGVGEAFGVEPVTIEAEPVLTAEQRLDSHVVSIIEVQCHASGTLLRQRVAGLLQELELTEWNITLLQAHSKGFLARTSYYDNADTYHKINTWIISLQSVIRGYLHRSQTSSQLIDMSFNEGFVTNIQAALRGIRVRRKLAAVRNPNEVLLSHVVSLQSHFRGHVVRCRMSRSIHNFDASRSSIEALQALCRAHLSCRRSSTLQQALYVCGNSVMDIQARSRAVLIRRHHRERLRLLRQNACASTQVQAVSRGFLLRKVCLRLKDLLKLESANVLHLQSLARAYLLRSFYRVLLLTLDAHREDIVNLQAACRGQRRRRAFVLRRKHYKDNMKNIIKVQSLFRAKQQGAAYRSLIEDKNPPISTIKSFVHLLDDNALDFEEEVATEQARRQIVQLVRQNEAAEEHIEQMDIKIALLVKQAIKIEEVIQHQKRLMKGIDEMDLPSSPHDLRAMNKTARAQLENFQRLFYVLQTQPVYIARLYTVLQEKKAFDQVKRLDALVMVLFGHAQNRREEYLFVKLLRASIIKTISETSSVPQFVHETYPWSNLYSLYNQSAKHVQYLRTVLGPCVRRIISEDNLDLDSDPCRIHRSLRGNAETGALSDPGAAISDPETRQAFILHLRDLRDLSEQLIMGIEDAVTSAPYGLKYLVSESLRAIRERFPDETNGTLLPIFGKLFYCMFLEPAFLKPDVHGVHAGVFNTKQRRNLTEIARLASHIFLGQYFDDASFLAPLNHFVDSLAGRMQALCEALSPRESPENAYDFSDFEDIVATKRPRLYIKVTDIYDLHALVESNQNAVVPEYGDVLGDVLKSLGPVQVAREAMGNSDSEIQLQLDPNAVDVDDPEADERVLFLHTKRLALYIIRIHSRSTFLEVLIEPVEALDETRWQTILFEEQVARRTISSQTDRTRKDLSGLSFAVVKREALENILKLEELGWVSRGNGYQDIINSIAQDIKSQNRRRIERQKDLSTAKATLQELTVKQHYLQSQFQSYNDYIEQAMLSLQGKKSKRKSVLPFTKQFFHLRDLQRAGSVPKFGSRKYSAYKLYTKGVLLSIRHESAPYDKFELVISSDQIGIFTVEFYSLGSIFARITIQLDELLQAQYNKQEFMDYNAGQFKFTVSATLNMLFKHFFN
ncbi:hypothetical protein BCR37DRAFT_399578 [Protomyces lactucae-debilis]|uniref:Uncharacterized protein n=1 Tax=Protomyces lactucae-debilis TaxID=2754530 RepID=A0A1Y2F9I4_PROLT|nr:uncharacterized protein BCR37DRAFT_399578 [Protomyces lactucae-debilis]ORY80533.1 hypothetical protein BCR37DRAFT_399578 [Protomyces lactucae-debilis]